MMCCWRYSLMELALETKQIKYSPAATPILDGLRALPERRWVRLAAGEYFFLSGAVILALIALPWLRRTVAILSPLGLIPAVLIACVFLPAAALLISLLGHEAGHLAAAWLVGFRRAEEKRSSDGKILGGENDWSCEIVRIAGFPLAPQNCDDLAKRLFLLFAAGPAVNFLFPAVLETVAAFDAWNAVARFFVHAVTAFSLLQGIADLLPDAGRAGFSDGSRLLMLLRRDASARRWLAIIEMQMAVRRGKYPASWDESALLAINAITDESRDALIARWLGYVWAGASQDITSATRYLESALEMSHSAAASLSDRLFLEAALFQAWFREDAGKARFWAHKMKTHPTSTRPLQQPRLAIALMWAEGKLFDSWEKLQDYLGLIRSLPDSPGRSFAERQAKELKAQMESRMLTRAWRTIYSMSQEVEKSTQETTTQQA